jgi:hypothetical protein
VWASQSFESLSKVLKASIVGNTDVFAKLVLGESRQRAMLRLDAQGLAAHSRTQLFARTSIGADTDEVQADFDFFDGFDSREKPGASAAECRVREPERCGERLAAGFLDRLAVDELGGDGIAQDRQESRRPGGVVPPMSGYSR